MEEKKLQLGDQGAAILTIQSTQSDPQKALAELIENSIDAQAVNVKILRHRCKGKIEIVVSDDGEGVKEGRDGNSDMERIATEICNSFKKQIDEHLKQNIHGEFAIGLLGFAAIGENLEMISRTINSPKTKFLKLKAGSLVYNSGTYPLNLRKSGTEVRIWPVRDNIQQRLTAEKLNGKLCPQLSVPLK
jgi:phage gp36-like protein